MSYSLPNPALPFVSALVGVVTDDDGTVEAIVSAIVSSFSGSLLPVLIKVLSKHDEHNLGSHAEL